MHRNWDWDDRWFHGWTDPWWNAGGWIMMVAMLAVAVALVVLAVWALREWPRLRRALAEAASAPATRGADAGTAVTAVPAAESPLDVARRRYAAGEIDRETYLQLVRDLGGTPPEGASGG